MAGYKKVTPGQPSSASPANIAQWCNDVTDVVSAIKQGRGGPPAANNSSSGIVKVKNLVEEESEPVDLSRGHYVQLGAYLLTTTDHRNIWLEGNLYDEAEDERIAILTRPLKGEKIGPARIIGVCTALVDVSSTAHRFAKPVDGEYLLESAASGPVEILSDMDSTGEQEVVVLLGGGGGGGLRVVKITEAIAAADHDDETDETTETEIELVERIYNSEGKRVDGDTIFVRNGLPDGVTAPGTHKFKVGYVMPDAGNPSRLILFQASCGTFDLPEEES